MENVNFQSLTGKHRLSRTLHSLNGRRCLRSCPTSSDSFAVKFKSDQPILTNAIPVFLSKGLAANQIAERLIEK